MKQLLCVFLTLCGFGVALSVVSGQQPADPFAGSQVPGEIIVKFKPGVDSATRAAVIRGRSATHLRRFDEVGLDHIRVGNGGNMAAELAQWRANPYVEYAQPNYVYRAVIAPAPLPNDPYWTNGSLYGMQNIGMPQAWQTFGGGTGSVIVADIDTGVQYTHPDLAANVWRNPGEIAGNGIDDDGNGYVDDVYGIDTVNHDSDPMGDASHGTHVAGTIAGVGNNGIGVVGVNWNAKILACKFLDSSGNGSDSGAIECLNYVVWMKNHGQNIRVTSNSWGSDRAYGYSAALQAAFDTAGNAGIINICAAGNSGTNNDTQPFDPASFDSPSIVSVAASDSTDARAGFSNYGASSVDLAAPGVNILSTVIPSPGYGYMSGTSMATPHVAGAAAYLAMLDPTLTPANLKVLLTQNVDVLPGWAGLVASGGRLNVFKAASALTGTGGNPGATVAFVGVDSSTQGNWIGTYGGDGYVVVNDATSLPAYATVTPTGQGSFTWVGSTTDVRALRRSSGTGRIASTWYASNSFDIDVNISGGAAKEVDLYLLDWDSSVRSERVDVLSFSNGVMLDTRTATNFNGGQYLRWNLQGHVILRVTRLGGYNAVVSGVFFGGGGTVQNQPPAVTLTSPSGGGSFAPGATIPMAANASDDGSVANVAFYADGNLLNTDTTAPYSYNWTTATNGPHTLTAVATDNLGLKTTSAPVQISVAPAGSNAVVFVKADAATRGDWNVAYGADGYSIINDATSLPAYATMTPSGQSSYTWATATTNLGALKRASGTGRIAAAWFNGGSFDIAFNTTGGAHQLALYFLDYDSGNRSQRVDILDGATNAVLDTRTVTSFSGGQYLVWNATGNVKARITALTGANGVVSGIFFGGAAASGNQPPVVNISNPTGGATFPSGAAITIDANASDDGNVASVAFYADGQLLNTDTVAPYSYTWATAATGSHTLTAVATDNQLVTTTSSPVQISVSPPGGSSVLFNGFNTSTQGNWIGVFGSAGYQVINDTTNLPAWATVTPSGPSAFTWAPSSTQPQALRKASGTDRIAACFYNGGFFDVSLGLGDGNAHQVALYFLDWDSTVRQQRVDVLDAATGAVLDTRTISGFNGGVYLVWTISGNVKFRVTRLAGANAVLSGIFIN